MHPNCTMANERKKGVRGKVVSIGIDTHVNAEEDVESCVLDSEE